MRIVSLNLRYAHNADMNNQGIREPRIVQFVKDFAPDVMGVQECEKFWRDRLVSTIGELGYIPAQEEAFGADDAYAFKNFIWYNSKKNDLVESGRIWLSETPDAPSRGFGSRFYISAGYAVVKSKESGECIAYINTHLDVEKLERRMNEIGVIKSKIKELESAGYAVFITGDFNDDQDSDVYRAMAEQLLDARFTAKVSTEKNTYNFCNSENLIVPDEKYRRLDYCFYNGDKSKAEIERFDVVDRWAGGYMSDHNAVIIDAKIQL